MALPSPPMRTSRLVAVCVCVVLLAGSTCVTVSRMQYVERAVLEAAGRFLERLEANDPDAACELMANSVDASTCHTRVRDEWRSYQVRRARVHSVFPRQTYGNRFRRWAHRSCRAT